MNKIIDFLELYEKMFRILPSENIQALMDVAYEIVGVPILSVDVTYNVLGISPQHKTGDYYWDYLLEHRGYETDMAVHLYEEGIMQSVNEQKAPYVIDWGGVNHNYPKIQGIIKINDIVEGYVTMQCKDVEITEDLMKAMEIVMNTCSLLYKNTDSENSMELTYQKAFIGELFNNRIQNQKQLELWTKGTDFRLNPPYCIVAISTVERNEKNVLSYIRHSIHQFYPYQLALVQHNTLYILQYNLDLCLNKEVSEKQFHTTLLKFNAHCGLSNHYSNLLDTMSYLIQAKDAMELGKSSGRKYRIHNYADYYLSAILAPRIEQMPPCNYLSPIIPILQEYDRMHSADLLKTLQVYINNLSRTSGTADELHIHRNSLMYRINKIEELADVSLKDFDTFMHLMISFYMMNA